MTAVDGAGLDGNRLRAEIAQAIRDRINVRPVWTSERLADALLTGPLAPLLAAARAHAALLADYRALAEELEREAAERADSPYPHVVGERSGLGIAAARLREIGGGAER